MSNSFRAATTAWRLALVSEAAASMVEVTLPRHFATAALNAASSGGLRDSSSCTALRNALTFSSYS